jgi:hypothetical protein
VLESGDAAQEFFNGHLIKVRYDTWTLRTQ